MHTVYPVIAIPGVVKNLNRCWEDVLHLGNKCYQDKGTIFQIKDKNTILYLQSGTFNTIHNYNTPSERSTLFVKDGCLIRDCTCLAAYNHSFPFHKCMTDVIFWKFSKDDIFSIEFQRKYPELIQNMMTSMATKYSLYLTMLSIVTQTTALKIISCFFVETYRCCKKSTFMLELSQQELSQLLGLHKATINRVIKYLRMENIILLNSRTNLVTILDYEKLNSIAYP